MSDANRKYTVSRRTSNNSIPVPSRPYSLRTRIIVLPAIPRFASPARARPPGQKFEMCMIDCLRLASGSPSQDTFYGKQRNRYQCHVLRRREPLTASIKLASTPAHSLLLKPVFQFTSTFVFIHYPLCGSIHFHSPISNFQ